MQPTAAAPVFKDNVFDLVLGGGGIKGLGHLGVIKAAWERGVRFGDVYGVSIGSLVSTLFMNGQPIETMTETFMTELELFGREAFTSLFTATGAWNVVRHGGAFDLGPFLQGLIQRHSLKPQPQLKILAAHWEWSGIHPHLFEGTEYNLQTALNSSCAVTPFIKPVPVQCGETKYRLVDGGFWHQAPHHFCQRPAIISRLGLAKALPEKKLIPLDLIIHVGEMAIRPVTKLFNKYSPEEHIVVPSGKPDVAALTFNLTDDTCKSLVKYAYDRANCIFDEIERKGCRRSKP